MTHSPVFSVWTSTSSSKDQEAELVLEEDAKAESVLNTESQKTKLWNGSEENTMVPSTTDTKILFNLSKITLSNIFIVLVRSTLFAILFYKNIRKYSTLESECQFTYLGSPPIS